MLSLNKLLPQPKTPLNILRASFFTVEMNDLLNAISASPRKWSNPLKQFVGNLPTSCLSAFDHFVGLALKGLTVEMND